MIIKHQYIPGLETSLQVELLHFYLRKEIDFSPRATGIRAAGDDCYGAQAPTPELITSFGSCGWC